MEKTCTFCQIIAGQKPADILYRGESVIVFRDIHPAAPIHLLVVPTRHIRSIDDLREEDSTIISELILTARDVAQRQSLSDTGYKLVFNVGRGGGQVIFHLHLHLLGGWSES